MVDYHHLQEIKEARPIKSKIVSEQWRTGKGKRQLLFFFSFPFPSSPARFLFPLSPASLRHPKGFWELKVRTEVPQGKINRGTGTVRS